MQQQVAGSQSILREQCGCMAQRAELAAPVGWAARAADSAVRVRILVIQAVLVVLVAQAGRGALVARCT